MSELTEQAAGKRVFVGLSGGVDSGVTAALLKDAGADVTGVFIKGWYPPGMPCSWAADRRDAMRVAAHLGIPFITLDAAAEYKAGVIDYLIREYRAGRTPNPDIMCNREVKFGAFYRFAREHNADAIATGHYARVTDGRLRRGIDEGKDQSYFLWAVPKAALTMALFPLGGMHKPAVRALAAKYQLPNAAKKDSQGICFLGAISVDEFLRRELTPAAGLVVDTAGTVISSHDGAVLYTLGERIALPDAPQGPWYVVAKDLEANTVTASRERFSPAPSSHIVLTDCNWLEESLLTASDVDELVAQYRYHGPRIGGTFDHATSAFVPVEPISEPLASGQSLVLYRGDVCVGGGIIA